MRCQRFGLRQGVRRENILRGSLTDEQRSRGDKDQQPFGFGPDARPEALLPILPPVRDGYAPSSRLAARSPEQLFPFYETGWLC